MNIRLSGERYVQRQVGTPLHPEYQKVKRSFICVAEGGTLFELNESHEIHLKDGIKCIACNLTIDPRWGVWPHYEIDDADKWSEHPKRCNHLYIP